MGAWIEIYPDRLLTGSTITSLPSWERGLKCDQLALAFRDETVAPLVGAWIEMEQMPQRLENGFVAPLVGAWIEIALIYFYFI